MSYPACPIHAGSRVVRNGRYGKPPFRRQRWRCVPADGSAPHRFAEPLPRQAAAHSHCSECSNALDAWEGQAGARAYLYTAREIAQGLALVARGVSYRRAAIEVRETGHAARKAGRPWHPRYPGQLRRRRGQINGQLIANWVDVFGPVVCRGLVPTRWPERLVVDTKSWRQGGVGGRSLYIFIAVGYAAGKDQGRLWLMRPYATKNAAAWTSFLGELEGVPQRIVSDLDAGIKAGISGAFTQSGRRRLGLGAPTSAASGPQHYLCEWHAKRQIAHKLEVLPRSHRAWDLLELALVDAARWDDFEDEVRHAQVTGYPQLSPLTDFFTGLWGPQLAAQIRARPPVGPYASGGLEAIGERLGVHLDGRVRVLGNRPRTCALLDLLACGFRNQVSETSWAAKIRRFLEANGGRPPAQRPHDDQSGAPSLYL